jgi:hypothetical protein
VAPPALGITYTWRVPLYSAENAIWLPSGENFGYSSLPACEVRRIAVPPLALATIEVAGVDEGDEAFALDIGKAQQLGRAFGQRRQRGRGTQQGEQAGSGTERREHGNSGNKAGQGAIVVSAARARPAGSHA